MSAFSEKLRFGGLRGIASTLHKTKFVINEDYFQANFSVQTEDIAALTALTNELIDLRLAQYKLRSA